MTKDNQKMGLGADVKLALANLLLEKRTVPTVMPSDGLSVRATPYAAPMSHSVFEGLISLAQAGALNPVGTTVTGSRTGPGAITLALAGALDYVTSYGAVLLDISTADAIPQAPINFSMAGTFADGETYASGAIELAYRKGASQTEQCLIFTAESIGRGPKLRPCRLAQTTFPGRYLNNASPNMAAADDLVITIATAPAAMEFTASIVTPAHEAYDDCLALMLGVLNPADRA